MTQLHRRSLLATATATALLAGRAAAQGSLGPIRIVVPFNPGGISDILARSLAQNMAGPLGRSVVVENRPGANGSIGAAAVARAVPDGTTLLLGVTDTHAVNPAAMRNVPYNALRDFTPISLITRVPLALAVGPTQRTTRDLPALIAAARAKPEALSHASWGIGSTAHIGMLRLGEAAGFEMLDVPYTGQAPAQQALAAGQVDAMILPAGAAQALATDGGVRVLAVLSPARLPLMPAVPTLQEQGVALSTGIIQAIFAPARLPEPLVVQFNAAMQAALRSPAMTEVLRAQAAVAEGDTPEALGRLVAEEQAAWGNSIRTANIRLD